VRAIPVMTFRTAMSILGQHDRPVLDRINDLLGGAILASGVIALTGAGAAPIVTMAAVWGWVDQKNEATGLARKLLNVVAGRRLGLAGRERMELVAAAHTVLAVSAVLEAFRERLGRSAARSLAKLSGRNPKFFGGRSCLQVR
jgi:hypothetical protein